MTSLQARDRLLDTAVVREVERRERQTLSVSDLPLADARHRWDWLAEDLLASGDTAGTTQAFDLFTKLLEHAATSTQPRSQRAGRARQRGSGHAERRECARRSAAC